MYHIMRQSTDPETMSPFYLVYFIVIIYIHYEIRSRVFVLMEVLSLASQGVCGSRYTDEVGCFWQEKFETCLY